MRHDDLKKLLRLLHWQINVNACEKVVCDFPVRFKNPFSSKRFTEKTVSCDLRLATSAVSAAKPSGILRVTNCVLWPFSDSCSVLFQYLPAHRPKAASFLDSLGINAFST